MLKKGEEIKYFNPVDGVERTFIVEDDETKSSWSIIYCSHCPREEQEIMVGDGDDIQDHICGRK